MPWVKKFLARVLFSRFFIIMCGFLVVGVLEYLLTGSGIYAYIGFLLFVCGWGVKGIVWTIVSSRYAVIFLLLALGVYEYKSSGNFLLSGFTAFFVFCFWVVKRFVCSVIEYNKNFNANRSRNNNLEADEDDDGAIGNGFNPSTGLPMVNGNMDSGGNINHFHNW